MNSSESRRRFLSRLASLLAGGAGLGMSPLTDLPAMGKALIKTKPPLGNSRASAANTTHAAKASYKVSAWTGDNFLPGHNFRDGKLPGTFPEKAERSLDFVIIGGGIAGLTAAFYLKDHQILLLDQYDQLGGQARGGSFQGIDYSYGPVTIDNIDGIYGQLYDQLKIAPVALSPDDETFYRQHVWTGINNGANAGILSDQLVKLGKRAREAASSFSSENYSAALTEPQLVKLDNMSFAAWLSSSDKELIELLDNLCKARSCGGTAEISALWGTRLLASLTAGTHAFAGGNAAVTKALVAVLKQANADCLNSGAFVWKIELHEDSCNVFYSTADGSLHNVECRQVICAAPPMVAWRLLSNLDDRQRANLMKFKYGSYLVSNCLLKKPLLHNAYDNWLSADFAFTDIVLAEKPYRLNGSYESKMGSVLTMRHPWEPGSPGRAQLLAGDRNAFARLTHDELNKLVTHLDQNLTAITLTRWGHAIAVPTPGYLSRLGKIAASYAGPYSLAHSSTQGMQSTEAAIAGARFAADRARKNSARTSIINPLNSVLPSDSA